MKNSKPRVETKHQALDEAEQTLHAIRDGAVDAFVVREPEGHRVYTLEGADLPYNALAERMQQGAAMLNARGELIYCNPSLAQLLGLPRENAIGVQLQEFVAREDRPKCQRLLGEAHLGESEGEMRLHPADGILISANFSFRLLSHDKSAIGVLVTDLTAQKQQQELASRLQQIQDDERRRIARELHDSVGQLLAAIKMNIARVREHAYKMGPDVAKVVDENAVMVDEISNEISTISHLLHPPLLDEIGLSSALRWYVDGFSRRSKIDTRLEIPENFKRLPQEAEIAIFRAVQECLTNVHRHSGSPSCRVKITHNQGQVRVEIQDSGRGIPKANRLNMATSGGVGFRGMRERLRQLGGTLEIESSDRGTTVIATLAGGPGMDREVAPQKRA